MTFSPFTAYGDCRQLHSGFEDEDHQAPPHQGQCSLHIIFLLLTIMLLFFQLAIDEDYEFKDLFESAQVRNVKLTLLCSSFRWFCLEQE